MDHDPADGHRPPSLYPPHPGGSDPVRETAADPLVAPSFGDWWAKTLATTGRSARTLLVLFIGLNLATLVLDLLGGGPITGRQTEPADLASAGGSLLVSLVLLVLNALVTAVAVYAVVLDAAGRRWTPGEAVGFAGRRFLPFIGYNILSGILVVIGTIVLIVPGLYLSTVFATLLGVVLIERSHLGRCFTLVNARFFPTFGRGVVLALIATVLCLPLALGPVLVPQASTLWAAIGYLALVPLQMLGTSALVVLYAGLRFHERTDVRTALLADEITAR